MCMPSCSKTHPAQVQKRQSQTSRKDGKCNKCFGTNSKAYPCPALPCPAMCTSNVGQVPEVWAACPDWRLHGDQQLCVSGHPGCHGADLWQHLPWGRPRHEQSPVQEDPGLQRGLPPPCDDVHLALSRSVCMWRLVRSLASHCMHLVSGIMTRSVVPQSPCSLQYCRIAKLINQHWLALLTWLSYGLTILMWECR